MTSEIAYIIARMSAWELAAYRRIGGYVPSDLLRRRLHGGERISDEDAANVPTRRYAVAPGVTLARAGAAAAAGPGRAVA